MRRYHSASKDGPGVVVACKSQAACIDRRGLDASGCSCHEDHLERETKSISCGCVGYCYFADSRVRCSVVTEID